MEKAMGETRSKHRRNDKAYKFIRKFTEYLHRDCTILQLLRVYYVALRAGFNSLEEAMEMGSQAQGFA